MSQTIEKYKVIVASPSDVNDERDSLNDVIGEINTTYGKRANLVIELIKWETHSAPGITENHTQDLIDDDFGTDYDLFIGILWKKFGTPTMKFNSGTEQEFRNAYSRFKLDPKSIQILFYFKIAAPSLITDINPDELKKIIAFKKEIGEKGILYWEYNTVDDLQKFLRIHIPQRIDSLKKVTQIKETPIDKNEVPPIGEDQQDELGIIDYQEIVEESFTLSMQAVERISEATEWIGNEVHKKATEFTSLNSHGRDVGKKILRDFFRRTTDIMNNYSSRIEPETTIFMSNFEKGTNAYSNLISIHRSDFTTLSKNDITEAYNSIEVLISGIESSLSGMNSFLKSISDLPRMAKELNQAKRNTVAKLVDLINKLEISHSIALEIKKNLTDI